MKQKKKSDVAVLLDYAGSHKGLTFLGLTLSAVSMLLSMAPYICIWLAARDLIAVAPDWTRAQDIAQYGWLAFAFAVAGIVLYFAGLMCTHLAAFRTAANIRKRGVAHVMKAPLGFFDSNASGLIRGRLDAAAAQGYTQAVEKLIARAEALRPAPIKEQMAKAAKEAAQENAAHPAPAKGKEARDDR